MRVGFIFVLAAPINYMGCKPKEFAPVHNTALHKDVLINYDRPSRRLTIRNKETTDSDLKAGDFSGTELHFFSPVITAQQFMAHEDRVRKCAGLLSFGNFLSVTPTKWVEMVAGEVEDVSSSEVCTFNLTYIQKFKFDLIHDKISYGVVSMKLYQGEGRKYLGLRALRDEFDSKGPDLLLVDFTYGSETKCIKSFKNVDPTLIGNLLNTRNEYIDCVLNGYNAKTMSNTTSKAIAPYS